MTQTPHQPQTQPQPLPNPQSSLIREIARDTAKGTGRWLGMAAFQALSILGLIVLGAAICGLGLYFQFWIVAIIGGVLIGAGVLWAAVLAFLFLDW
ncbi:MAG: hypothetical protein ACIAQF_11945 [Phycisphaerales bacterium JB065]